MPYELHDPRRRFRPQHLKRFKELRKSEFGIDLTNEKAESELGSPVAEVRYQHHNKRFQEAMEVREFRPNSQPISTEE